MSLEVLRIASARLRSKVMDEADGFLSGELYIHVAANTIEAPMTKDAVTG
jgi:hypothetical protein